RYPNLLERRLGEPESLKLISKKPEASPTKVEVINLSHPAFTDRRTLDALEKIGLGYQPDLILVEANVLRFPSQDQSAPSWHVLWNQALDTSFFLTYLASLKNFSWLGLPLQNSLSMPSAERIQDFIERIRKVAGSVPVIYLLHFIL